MTTGENIQFLRKRDGYTQEGFAEKMGVSRQTISKWESDSCYPEMDKLVLMCEMFHCKLDDLVRGDVQMERAKDTAGYDAHMNTFTKKITVGVVLVMLGVCAMLFALALGIPEAATVLPLLVFIAVSLIFFISGGIEHDHFVKKHPEILPFYDEEELDAFRKKFALAISIGVALILLGVIVLIGGTAVIGESTLDASDRIAGALTGTMLLFITAGTGTLVYAGMQNAKYDVQEYNSENKHEKSKAGQISDTICGCIMLLATIVYLLWSFLGNSWGISWIVFPVGGLLCAVTSTVCKLMEKQEETE